MTAEVIPFPERPSRQELEARVRALAQNTGNINFEAPHFQERLQERGILMRQVLDVLRNGEAIHGPTKDQWGDWRIKMRRLTAGRRVQVVVAVRETELIAITVI
ncbi:DUF4258 domain-containing protein [Salinarimonas rosea]|uniref:DUF4258 domain-containing protein n=1 Tax=Salinarimonas rosea TaxID=552063 RepID=UPI0004058BFC|nr:DUF4258 domain-containing protein [Salinarimonas rosea]